MVERRIDLAGKVADASILTDEIADPEFSSCVLATLRTSFSSPPTGGCAEVRVQLTFRPKQHEPKPLTLPPPADLGPVVRVQVSPPCPPSASVGADHAWLGVRGTF